jgi:hypothetical protein
VWRRQCCFRRRETLRRAGGRVFGLALLPGCIAAVFIAAVFIAAVFIAAVFIAAVLLTIRGTARGAEASSSIDQRLRWWPARSTAPSGVARGRELPREDAVVAAEDDSARLPLRSKERQAANSPFVAIRCFSCVRTELDSGRANIEWACYRGGGRGPLIPMWHVDTHLL